MRAFFCSFQTRFWFLLLLVFCLTSGAAAWARNCAVCGRTIKGRYIVGSDGKAYCSRRCFEKSLPTCAVCGKRLHGKFLTANGKTYCSEKCWKTTLPVCELCGRHTAATVTIDGHVYCPQHGNGPRCASCGLPYLQGKHLKDGRTLCLKCFGQGVFKREAAAKLYRRARREQTRLTGDVLVPVPVLRLVGIKRLNALLSKYLGNSSRSIRGFYDRREETTTSRLLGRVVSKEQEVHKTIYILYGLGPKDFLATAVHETTHDWLWEKHPEVGKAPLWVAEGICQYAAATVCRRLGYRNCLREIEQSRDPVYGDGYRYFANLLGPDNWSKLEAWLRAGNPARVPDQAPKSSSPQSD